MFLWFSGKGGEIILLMGITMVVGRGVGLRPHLLSKVWCLKYFAMKFCLFYDIESDCGILNALKYCLIYVWYVLFVRHLELTWCISIYVNLSYLCVIFNVWIDCDIYIVVDLLIIVICTIEHIRASLCLLLNQLIHVPCLLLCSSWMEVKNFNTLYHRLRRNMIQEVGLVCD